MVFLLLESLIGLLLVHLSLAFEEGTFPKNHYYDPYQDKSISVDLKTSYFNRHNYLWIKNYSKESGKSWTAQIPSPMNDFNKESLSLMFWPIPLSKVEKDPKCPRTLGLNAIPFKNIKYIEPILINSNLYFERYRIKKQDGSLVNYIQTIFHDKTSKSSILNRRMSKKIEEKSSNNFICDNLVINTMEKFYIVCWKIFIEKDKATSKDRYLMKIELRKSDPNPNENPLLSGLNFKLTKEQYESIDKTSEKSKILQGLSTKSTVKDQYDLAFYMREQYFFFIARVQKEKFKKFIYPHEFKNYTNLNEPVPLNTLKYSDKPLKLDQAKYIDELRFILIEYIDNFDDLKPKKYPSNHYLDARTEAKPIGIGHGVFLTYRTGYGPEGDRIVSEVLLIHKVQKTKYVNKEGLTKVRLKIRTQKFYHGFFYNDKSFEISIFGEPSSFKANTLQDYYVFIESRPMKPAPECPSRNYSSSIVSLAPIDAPHLYREAKIFDQGLASPLLIIGTPLSNLIYVRFPHKLEVFYLEKPGIDLKNPHESFGLKEFKLNMSLPTDSIRVMATKEEDPNIQDIENPGRGVYINIRPNQTDIMELVNLNPLKPSTESSEINLQLNYTKHKSKYRTLFDTLVGGNYICFDRFKLKKGSKVSMPLFEKGHAKLETKKNIDISNAFRVDYQGTPYVVVSFSRDQGNFIYKYKNRSLKMMGQLYDSRVITSFERLTERLYLIHIKGMLYQIDFETLDLQPLFKSNDYCGTIFAKVKHLELGYVTVCGGKDELTVFAPDPKMDKIDLSNPLANVKVQPTLRNSIKNDQIDSLVADIELLDRFVVISKQIVYKDEKEDKTLFRVRLRLIEIASAREEIRLYPESEKIMEFEHPVKKIKGYVLKESIVIVVSLTKGADIVQKIVFYRIKATFELEHTQTISLPPEVLVDIEDQPPMKTYLSIKKNTISRVYGQKLFVIVNLKGKNIDPIKEFDFFNFKDVEFNSNRTALKSRMLGIISGDSTSLDSFNFVLLPNKLYFPYTFGEYFLNSDRFSGAMGATIVTKHLKNERSWRLYFLKSHSMSVDFTVQRTLESYFDKSLEEKQTFSFAVKDILKGSVKTINAVLHEDLKIRKLKNLEINKGVALKIDLDEQKSIPKAIDLFKGVGKTSAEDMILGDPYSFDFKYDSIVEKEAGKISANLFMNVNSYPKEIADGVSKMVATKLSFDYKQNSFVFNLLERLYPNEIRDYVQLLYASADITVPTVEISSKSHQKQYNPIFGGKYRCSKFFVMADPKVKPQELVLCLGLKSKTYQVVDLLDFFIFDERSGDDLYSTVNPLLPVLTIPIDLQRTPFQDLSIITSLNTIVLKYRNPTMKTVYKYSVYRVESLVQKESSKKHQFRMIELLTNEIWVREFEISNTFYKPENSQKVIERFCLLSIKKLTKINLAYYCVEYDPNIPKKEDISKEFQPETLIGDVFSFLKYDDIETVDLEISLYNPTANPISEYDMIVRDSKIYFIFSMPSYHTFFAFLEPNKEGDPQVDSGSFKFVPLCNPTEGYVYKKEFSVMNDNYYARIGVTASNRTDIFFFSLPSRYSDESLEDYSFYKKEEWQAPNFKLKCIQSKSYRRLDEAIQGSILLYFNEKNVERPPEADYDKDFYQVNIASTTFDGKPFVFNYKALHFLLYNEKNFYQIEYLPRIVVKPDTPLLLSNSIWVEIRGMLKTSIMLKIELISGKLYNPIFLLKYFFPLLVLIGVLWLGQWLLNKLLETDTNTSTDENEDTEQATVAIPLRTLGQTKRSNTLTEKDLGAQIAAASNQGLLDISESSDLKKKMAREVLCKPVLSEDQTYYEEIYDADHLTKLYRGGQLKMETEDLRITPPERKAHLQAALEEESRLEPSPVEIEDYLKQEQFIRRVFTKVRRTRTKELLSLDQQAPPAQPEEKPENSQNSENSEKPEIDKTPEDSSEESI